MVNKENAKQQIRELLEKYDKVVEEKRFSKYTEEETKKDFILPLFRALGWNVEDSTEVAAEETISRGRVDYSFRINGIPKFFLEAKPLKADLDDPKFASQVINYAWHKGCTWAVLTDFDQGVKIFNAEWKATDLFQSHLKTIPRQEFLDRFKELWLLSKESFEQGLLDKEAEKWGKKSKKSPVGEQLFKDLTTWRAKLSKDIMSRNKDKQLTEEYLDEAVQRIIDRLIFIRNCEDRKLEEETLLSVMRIWGSKPRGTLAERIVDVFRHFDEEYNSKLFQHHLCDDLDISNQVLEGIIKDLYHTKDRIIKYDFSAIDADVLGNVYEQYLGHILKKTAKRAIVTEKHVHRKEQGIYYTPTYVVDYIVRNTLGELLKDKKVNVEKIRVLDPACGSGSFLIKAFDVLNEFYSKKEDHTQTQLDLEMGLPFKQKEKVLLNNIFGVDLDEKAVEIAQLNLLLKIAEKKQRLPLLQKNIKCGNSLIGDEKVAREKAFKWENEFKQIMDESGFHVIIGNPPYVRPHKISAIDKKFLWKNFRTFRAKSDLYNCFMEKGIRLLREGGLFSFIVPHTWVSLESFYEIRRYILENCKVHKLVQLPKKVFKDATVETTIFVLIKEPSEEKRDNNVIVVERLEENRSVNLVKKFKQSQIKNNHLYNFELYSELPANKILTKVKQKGKRLGKLINFFYGLKTGDDKKFISDEQKNQDYKKLLRSKEIKKYSKTFKRKYVYYLPELMIKNKKTARPGDKERFETEKIIVARMGKQVVATYDDENYYVKDGMLLLKKSELTDLRYITGILNSKLINYYYKNYFITIDVLKNALLELPIAIADKNTKSKIVELVKMIEELNQRLNEIGDKKTDQRYKIEEEIKRTDAEIDEMVYKLYGITEEEKKIIEESLKK